MKLWMAIVLLCASVVGCGGGEEQGPAPSEAVQMMIANLPDAAQKPDRWPTFFATGAAPGDSERPKYGKLMLRPQDAQLGAGSGTVKVLVEDLDGRQVGEVEWAVVQEGGAWKIKSAPLP